MSLLKNFGTVFVFKILSLEKSLKKSKKNVTILNQHRIKEHNKIIKTTRYLKFS